MAELSNMSRLVIICTVCLTFIVFSKGRQINMINMNELLKMIEKKVQMSTSSEDSSSTDDDYPVALRTMDVLELIKKNNLNEKYKLLQQNELLKKQSVVMPKDKLVPSKQYPLPFLEQRHDVPSNILTFNKRDVDLNGLIKQQVIDHLTKNVRSSKKTKNLVPNRLLSPVTLEDDDERENDKLNEYSKIYVIMDPSAFQKNGNKNDEESLISKILSLSSAMNKKSHQGKNNVQYYKGFKVKDDFSLRRYRRDSKEAYNAGDEDEVVKKRPSGLGGGGGAGRTAIPYVKLRGDIYERDH